MAVSAKVNGPDFSRGVLIDILKDGESLLGHVGAEPVLLVRQDGVYYAVGAQCSHYKGPLNEGLVVGHTIHCPWHHACFDLKTGQAVKAPALNPIAAWNVEQNAGKVFVFEKKPILTSPRTGTENQKFVIIGAGAAGTAAAVMLRRQGFLGHVSLISNEKQLPYDRPQLSKGYLAGLVSEELLPLYAEQFYDEYKIKLELGVRAIKIDSELKQVRLSNGVNLSYDRCLIATGGEPRLPTIPGILDGSVYVLRSLQDAHRIIARTAWAQTVVVMGAGFIGLEVASALRKRNMQVHIVAPEEVPLTKVMGPQVGAFLKRLHESHGVQFHLGQVVKEIREGSVLLDSGKVIETDFVIVGMGIDPNVEIAETAGCDVDGGVLVNTYLETSKPGIFAAGDIARWLDSHSSRSVRVEHWEVAERQGQVAALNMLGDKVRFQEVPFFWTQQFDVYLGYVGQSTPFDRLETFGEVGGDNFAIAYYEKDRVVGLLTVGRDRESLMFEEALQHNDEDKIQHLLRSYAHLNHSSKQL